MKAIMLLSGGLDSRLAMKLLLDQGVQLHAFNHVTLFCTCTAHSSCKHEATKAAEQFGVPLTVKNVTEELLEVVKNPKHGYGSGVNPCIDCRIMLFRNARRLMEETGAAFIVTGEVLGERPMSQRKDAMRLIERESGLDGLVVRPLCALVLEPSIPEKEGWVDRDKFKAITGRRRLPQMALAKELGIGDYPCPAGGCRLTEPGFAHRMRDLLEHEPDFSVNDVQLLKLGRHYRLSPSVKAVVGRNEAENAALQALRREGDVLLEVADFPGPLTVVRGPAERAELLRAAAITARHSKARNEPVATVCVSDGRSGAREELQVRPAEESDVRSQMVGTGARARGSRMGRAGPAGALRDSPRKGLDMGVRFGYSTLSRLAYLAKAHASLSEMPIRAPGSLRAGQALR